MTPDAQKLSHVMNLHVVIAFLDKPILHAIKKLQLHVPVSLLRLIVAVKMSILQIAIIANMYKVEERKGVALFKTLKVLLSARKAKIL